MTGPTIDRRQMIAACTGVIGSVSLAGCVGTGKKGKPSGAGYVDAHSHVWTPDTQRFPLGAWVAKKDMKPQSFTAEQLMTVAKASGVERVVLIQHAPYYGDNNAYLIDCAKRYPGRFSIVAIVEERRKDLSSHLASLKAQGIRGIRVGPGRYADRSLVKEPMAWLKASAMRLLWKHATELDLALCPLISAKFLPTLTPMLEEFKDTTVVLDHFAHATAPQDLETLLRFAKHKHLHVKVSAFYKFGDRKAPYEDLAPLIKRVHDAFGPNRLLWGSDCPYQLNGENNYADAVTLIETGLDFLDPAGRDAILRRTATRLFF